MQDRALYYEAKIWSERSAQNQSKSDSACSGRLGIPSMLPFSPMFAMDEIHTLRLPTAAIYSDNSIPALSQLELP
jgi:hypothetical protein